MEIHPGQIPLFRLIIPFIAGILFQIHGFEFSFFPFHLLFFVAFICFCLFNFQKKLRESFALHSFRNFLLLLNLFLAGIILTNYENQLSNKRHFSNYIEEDSTATNVTGIIKQPVKNTPKTQKAVVGVKAVWAKGKWMSAQGNLLCYFIKSQNGSKLKYGDRVHVVNSEIKRPPPPSNPGAFNYREYLSYRQVFHQCFVDSAHFVFLEDEQGNEIFETAYNIRSHLQNVLKRNGFRGEEFAVVSALLLGDRSAIDNELKSDFAGAGATHVLAVSGLHVGMIFLVLEFLLRFITKDRINSYLKAILLVIFLWAYAFITGLSPSVMRAAAMFSFLVVGKAINTESHFFNTLSASAFLLLIIDPFMIMKIGFQLSYLAVMGIVLVHPFVYGLVSTRYLVLDKIWSLTAVSVAAQLGTFPLSLYYFHQFPNYFFITNLLVIPCATIILYGGFLFITISEIPFLNEVIAFGLKKSVLFLNSGVKFINGLPGALSENVYLSFPQTLLIYAAVLSLVLFFKLARFRFLKAFLIFVIIIITLATIDKNRKIQQSYFVVYSSRGGTLIDFINGKEHFQIRDSVINKNQGELQYLSKGNDIEKGLYPADFKTLNDLKTGEDVKIENLYIKGGCGVFRNLKFRIIFHRDQLDIPFTEKYDVIVITGDPDINIEKLLKNNETGLLIFDATNSYYKREFWKKECQNSGVKIFDVSDSGAYVQDL